MVIGLGGVGLNIVQGARICGATKIIGIDINDTKVQIAKKFGMTDFINIQKQDINEAIMDITSGMGVDYSFEAVGNVKLLETAFSLTRKRGTIVSVGIAPENQKVELTSTKVTRDEKKFTGTFYGSANCRLDFPKIAQLYKKGELLLDELVSKVFPLEKINEAVDSISDTNIIRSVIKPHM